MADLPPSAATPAALTPALVYDGRLGELYPMFIKNLLLTIVTLGIYRFWAITNYRHYFWSRMRFQGERFEYTGTGGQLFVGFLLAGLILIGADVVLGLLAAVLSTIYTPLAAIPLLVLVFGVMVLAAGAIFSAQRYRLTRTLWCGIRGGMEGSMVAYGLRALLYGLLAIVTLLQMIPWMQVRLAERRINASSFGTARFGFRGSAKQVYVPYLLTWAGTVGLLFVIGGAIFAATRAKIGMMMAAQDDPQVMMQLVSQAAWVVVPAYIAFIVGATLLQCWYYAVFERHVVGHTTLGPVRLASSVTGPGLAGLVVGNLFILVFTLALGLPIVLHRNAAFIARTLWIDGAIDPAQLGQNTSGMPSYGEGMFQQLDAGGIL